MKNIGAKEVEKLKKENPQILIINVLSEESYRKEHVPGSINVPVENKNFVEMVTKKAKDKTSPLVVYCASFKCPASTNAATLLEQNGFTNVIDFKGGMEEWHNLGYKVEVGG